MTDYGRTDIFLGESRVNRSALLLQQQVFLHNKINRTIPETGYFCAVPGFLRFKRADIWSVKAHRSDRLLPEQKKSFRRTKGGKN